MEIGTQRDTQVCLKGCDWRQLILKVASLLTALLLASMIMITPAHAATQTIPSTSLPPAGVTCTIFPWETNGSYPDAQTACHATTRYLGQIMSYTTVTQTICNPAATPYEPSYQVMYNTWFNMGGTLSCSGTPVCPQNTSYNPATGMCERTVPDCPANSSRSDLYPFQCACHTGFKFDAVGGICVPLRECPVTALPAFPPANDACAQALENFSSTQAQKNAACGTLTPAMQTGQTCLENKLAAMTPAAIPFARTADIRSVAYQAHFRDIWDKMEDIVRKTKNDPAMQTACAARRAEIAAEKGCDNAGACTSCYPSSGTQRSHCFKGRPARPDPNGALHTQANAIDVSEASTIDPLKAALAGRNPPQNVQQFLDAPTNCNLIWGGTFTTNYDPVHFQVR